MSHSLMQLKICWQAHLEIRTNEAFSPLTSKEEACEMEHSIGFDVKRHKTQNSFKIPLNVLLRWENAPNAPFSQISIGVVGIFSFPEDTSEEEISKYVPLLCLTNLYGFARGIVANATGLCPSGAYFLPTLNMNDVVRDAAIQEEETPIEDEKNSSSPELK